MNFFGHETWSASVMLVLLFLFVPATLAAPPGDASATALLSQLKVYSNTDHARFLAVLHRLDQPQMPLTENQRRTVEFWQAWEMEYEGDYKRSIRLFEHVVAHAHDPLLVTRARTNLSKLYSLTRAYVKAFTVVNAMIENLPAMTDPGVHDEVLVQANQILTRLKQYDQALKYAEQLKARATTDKARCKADFAVTNTLLQRGGVLTSSSPRYRQTVDQCLTAGMLAYANALRLNWADQMVDEGHAQQALAFLDRITPDINKDGYHGNITGLYVDRALAYLADGNYTLAQKWAQAILSDIGAKTFNWKVQKAYKVLYQVQEHFGDYKSALDSHENYMAQYKASNDDAKAQALAFQIVKQEVLTKRLKLEELSKQNRILKLRQSLDRKSVENNHLYLTILLMLLAFLVFWAYRIKHSQLRFRKMARHDDLTGSFNRPYFLEQSERALQRLEKSGLPACLTILDLDHFKRINDLYGHVSGDIVLRHATHACRAELRESDVFGRLGGEEFGILMPGCTPEQGREIGERMRLALSKSSVRMHGDESITVTCSIGLACTQQYGYALKPLLVHADKALYEAKRGGRNRLIISQSGTQAASA